MTHCKLFVREVMTEIKKTEVILAVITTRAHTM